MKVFTKEELELCRQTIGMQVEASLTVQRAARFNHDASLEHYLAVVRARWAVIESVIYAEINRIEVEERCQQRTHGADSAIDDEEPALADGPRGPEFAR